MRSSILFQFTLLVSVVLGHPEPDTPLTAAQLAKRRLAARERHLLARNCASQISEFTNRRREKRSLARRNQVARADSTSSSTISGSTESSSTSTSTASSPHYTEIQNSTCITAPEVTEGPYYINNELVRQNLIEDQQGVKLVLDIGVVDTVTCEPLPNVFIEIWAANATGVYGGYPASLGGGLGGGGPPPDNTTTIATDSMTSSGSTSTNNDSTSTGSDSTNTDTTTITVTDITTATATPTGVPPGGPGGAMSLARNETFLRGGLPTDDNGIVELITLYPGYYEGRTAHIHMMAHLNWEESDNGTLVSHAGSLLHIGQFFFDESWNDQVFAFLPYATNTNNRTLNVNDSILAQENSDGNNAFLSLELLGGDLTEGILGYITVGVNSSASYNITNTNYLNSSTTTDTLTSTTLSSTTTLSDDTSTSTSTTLSSTNTTLSDDTSTSTASFIARAMGFAAGL